MLNGDPRRRWRRAAGLNVILITVGLGSVPTLVPQVTSSKQIVSGPLQIYVEAISNTPAALFVDARSATRDGRAVRLDDGSRVESGVLTDRTGRRRPVDRPQQMFTRWYGFSLTFPGCEVFGGAR